MLVSEPYAYRHGVRAGAQVRLVTDRGPREFQVAGVFHDYGTSGGALVMSRATYDRFWDDRGVTALALYAAPGVAPADLVGRLRARAAEGAPVVIRATRDLREASLEVFDRTFRITGVLRLMIVGVAFVGVLSALMALELERGRETGLLRALGLTPRQVWAMVTAETGLIGALAGLFARAARLDPRGDPGPRDQPALVRLDHAALRRARRPRPGRRARDRRRAPRRALSRAPDGARAGGGGAAR